MDTKHRAASLQQQNYRMRHGTRDKALSTAANYITLVVGMCVWVKFGYIIMLFYCTLSLSPGEYLCRLQCKHL